MPIINVANATLSTAGTGSCASDSAAAGLDFACREAAGRGLRLSLRRADADALPSADESFDYVLSWNVNFHGTMGDVGRRLTEIWRVLKPGGLYQGTMLSKRDAQFGRGRPVAPDTFIRGSDPKAHPHYYCDLADLCRALRRLRASVADPGGAAPPWLLALAHPRRTAVNGDGSTSAPSGRADAIHPRRASSAIPSSESRGWSTIADQRGRHRPVFRAFVAAGEQRILSAESNRAHCTLDGAGVDLDAAVIEG